MRKLFSALLSISNCKRRSLDNYVVTELWFQAIVAGDGLKSHLLLAGVESTEAKSWRYVERGKWDLFYENKWQGRVQHGTWGVAAEARENVNSQSVKCPQATDFLLKCTDLT